MLNLPDPVSMHRPITQTWGHGPVYHQGTTQQRPHYCNFTLTANHPLRRQLESLPELAHIPRWRFDEPIARFWRSDLLLTLPETRAIFENLELDWEGRADGVEVDLDTWWRTLSPWHENFQYYADNIPGWEGELPSLVLLSTGPHWEVARFAPLLEAHLWEAYAKMVSSIRHFLVAPLLTALADITHI